MNTGNQCKLVERLGVTQDMEIANKFHSGGMAVFVLPLLFWSCSNHTMSVKPIAAWFDAQATATPTTVVLPLPSAIPTPVSVNPQTGAPHLNFTDIVTGSGTGGDNGNGAYVNLYGTNLGSSGSITVGGASAITNCSNCRWTDSKVIFQLGASAASGNIVLTNSSGTSSGLAFTITATSYYYISPNGSDTANGSYFAPFKTLRHFLDSVAPISQNTIIYFMNGFTLTGNDGRGWNTSAAIDSGGKSESIRLNLVAYPGAVVTIGSPNINAQYGMVTYSDYVTIAGLNLRGYSSFEANPSTGFIRFIGNDVSCQNVPASFGDNACLFFGSGSSSGGSAVQTKFLGNTVHDTGGPNADKTYHAVYFGTDMNQSEAAWNTIGTGVFYGYCRSILLHSSPNGNPGSGRNMYGYEIHDNFIQKGWCDGIGLASVDPSKGAINIYNNVLVNIGTSTDGTSNAPPSANNTAIAVNTDPMGASSGSVHAYNNTIYAGGVYSQWNSNGCFGIVFNSTGLVLNNNICDQTSSAQPYLEVGASGTFSGSHNVWYGNGAVPTWDASGLHVNPLLLNAANYKSAADFSVGFTASPMVGAQILNGQP